MHVDSNERWGTSSSSDGKRQDELIQPTPPRRIEDEDNNNDEGNTNKANAEAGGGEGDQKAAKTREFLKSSRSPQLSRLRRQKPTWACDRVESSQSYRIELLRHHLADVNRNDVKKETLYQ